MSKRHSHYMLSLRNIKMDGICFVIVFLLLVRYSTSKNCDCKLVDILQTILQREMLERAKLESRVDMLESKLGSSTNNSASSSGQISDTVLLERLSDIETMIENFKETSLNRQSGERLYSALTNAWNIHKRGFSEMNEEMQKSISDNNKRVNQLTTEIDKTIKEVEFKVDMLINQAKNIVSDQLENVDDRFEVIHAGFNQTFKDYTTNMNQNFVVFTNHTDSTINSFRAAVNGGWTSWSSWSSCSVTCGEALKTRTRTCTNPEPTQSGLACIGNSEDKEICGNFPCFFFAPVRLVNGSGFYEGRLEVRQNGVWGTVCDDEFTDMAARVVCKMLGLSWSSATQHQNAYFGPGTLPIVLDDVVCNGTELSIFACNHKPWGSNNCGHGEDVGVSCRG